ncbi:MAG: hypothetical protein ACR2PK_05080 [Acidimicrobiales bacterium]
MSARADNRQYWESNMSLLGMCTHTRTLGMGKFRCPRERASTRYELCVVRQWGTIGHRRVVRMGELTRFVECRSCGSTYEPTVLAQAGGAPVEDVVTRVLRRTARVLLPSADALTPAQRREAVIVLQRYANVPYGSADLRQDLDCPEGTEVEIELRDLGVALNDRGRSTVIDAGFQLLARSGTADARRLESLEDLAETLSISPESVKQAATRNSAPVLAL